MTYSSSAAYSRRASGTRNRNSVSFAARGTKLGPVSNSIVLIVLACMVGLLYLTQVTKTNSYGYTINSLEQEQSKLYDQRADLEVSSARLQSLERVAGSDVAKNLATATPSGSIQ